jgi:hypothetical protein
MLAFCEAVLVYFKTLSQHKPFGTEEHHINLREHSRGAGQDSNRVPPECETEVLSLEPTSFVHPLAACYADTGRSLPFPIEVNLVSA